MQLTTRQQINKLHEQLITHVSLNEVRMFGYDHYPAVYQLPASTSLADMLWAVIDAAQAAGDFSPVLELLKYHNRTAYQNFMAWLDETVPTPVIAEDEVPPPLNPLDTSLSNDYYYRQKEPGIMKPDVFIEEAELPDLLTVCGKFATHVPISQQRQAYLSGIGLDTSSISNWDAIAVVFKNHLSAVLKSYSIREDKLKADPLPKHPLVIFLQALYNDPDAFRLDDADMTFCEQLINRGETNMQALAARNGVGRIESPLGTAIGTGVLIAPDLLLTCNHLFSDANIQYQQAWVRFQYRKKRPIKPTDLPREPVFELEFPPKVSRSSPDFAMLKIKPEPDKPVNQRIIRPVKQILSFHPTTPQLRIIHHPNGDPAQVSELGQIIASGADYLHHNLPTAKGSSGGPIFNKNWQLVAIHRGVSDQTPPPNCTEAVPLTALWDYLTSYKVIG